MSAKYNKKLSNPLAIATVASSDEGQKAIGNTLKGVQILLVVAGTFMIGSYAWNQFKKWRAEKYANENAGNPNLIAAAIIYNSFSRFEAPGILSFLLPSFDISADEDALYNIASKVTNVKAVSDAYKILFDRNLVFDTQNGLDSQELQTFWNIINAPQQNNDTSTPYPIGSILYSANRDLIINTAEKNENEIWEGTNILFGQFQLNDEVGKIVDTGKVTLNMTEDESLVGQVYYIIEDCNWLGFNCKNGVVVHSQVRNKEL